MGFISRKKVRRMERNKINVIMELSYRMDSSNSLLSRKNIRKDYFPGIFKVVSYEESETDRMIQEVIDINNTNDKYSRGKSPKILKVAYLVTEDSYKEYSKDFFGEEHDIYDDMDSGIFFNRNLHENIISKFFNSKPYIKKLKSEGLLKNNKIHTIHTMFTYDLSIREALSKTDSLLNEEVLKEVSNKTMSLYIRSKAIFDELRDLKNKLNGLDIDKETLRSTSKSLEYTEVAASYLSDVNLKLLKRQGVDFDAFINNQGETNET